MSEVSARRFRIVSGLILELVLFAFGVSALPALAASETPLLDVVVSEISWMGTTTSSNDEWIELFNNTDSPIDLTG